MPGCESCAIERLARIDLAGVPQHIVQRGNNRLHCFLDDGDRLRYLHLMREAPKATGCKLHAYVLMDNHVHLLVTPPAAGRIGQLMQRLGRNYFALFNARHGRTDTLWKPASWTVLTTSLAAIATLSSIRYVLA
ncbi:transposase [Xanthomonas arboricola]|uniref:transposase n=1 Tax=Xanthomonas arboricola TaxID=56448 RepID=UPI001EDD62CB|nr:transposase [Xanthomonas arboricola]